MEVLGEIKIYNAAKNIAKVQGTRYKEEDRRKYGRVECRGALHFYLPNSMMFDEMLAKVCYICDDELLIEVSSYVSKNEMERNGFGDLPGGPTKGVSTLRMERLLQFNGFKLLSKQLTDGGEALFQAKRMPEIEWDGVKDLWAYPEDVVVEVPLDHPSLDSFWKRWALFSKYDYPVWTKYKARVKHIINNFKPWMWQPLWYCVECERQHQGGHRLHVAKQTGRKTVKYWMMHHFWNAPKQRDRHYYGLKKTIRECEQFEAENNIVRTEPFVEKGEVIG